MLIKGLIGYLPAQIIQGIVGFVALSLFTRLLSADDYGRYALALGLSSLVHTLLFTAIEAAMARFAAREAHDGREATLFGTLYGLCLAANIVLFGLMVVIYSAWPIHNQADELTKTAVLISLSSAGLRCLYKLVQEQRRAVGNVTAAAVLEITLNIGGLLLALALIKLGLGGGSVILGAGLIAGICFLLAGRNDLKTAIKGRFDPIAAKSYLSYGWPVAFSLILSLVIVSTDRWLIAYFLGETDVGAYHAAYSLASRILDVLFIWIGMAAGPAMIHAYETGSSEDFKKMADHQIGISWAIGLPACAGLIMVSPALSELLIGENLRSRSLSLIPVIAIGALMSGLMTYYSLQAFILAKKTKTLNLVILVPALVNIGLNLVLIPLQGLMGAAIATLVSFFIGFVISIIWGRRFIKLPLALPSLVKSSTGCLVMVGVLMLLPRPGGAIELLLLASVGALIYGIMGLITDLLGMRHGARTFLAQFLIKRSL
jgi:O-antigen/teichoic acid export membrane protein